MVPKWMPLVVGGALSPKLRDRMHVASGAYAVRRKKGGAVVYVGESSTGNLRRTMLRHFQAPSSFAAQRDVVILGDPAGYEVAVWITSRGHRPLPPLPNRKESRRIRDLKKRGVPFTTETDQKALDAQASWIARFEGEGHELLNQDDGRAAEDDAAEPEGGDDSFAFGANPGEPRASSLVCRRVPTGGKRPRLRVKKNPPRGPALPATNVAAEKLATNRTPDLWTGRTKLEEGGKNARRDWKGEAERTARELAECRRGGAAAPVHAPKTIAPKALPEGYGTTDEKGQATMFRRNPTAAPPVGKLTELGILTELCTGRVAMAWNLRDAPVLAYDSRGRLFIVYAGKVIGPSTPAARKEYARKHWGARGRGTVRGGGRAVGPFRAIGKGTTIQYTTKKGADRQLVNYVHEWGEGGPRKFTPPTIVIHDCKACEPRCAARGALAIAGGTYKVTERGIVG